MYQIIQTAVCGFTAIPQTGSRAIGRAERAPRYESIAESAMKTERSYREGRMQSP